MKSLLIGVALILVTNAVVLGGVAYNRSGEPESTLRLTERELRIRNWSWPENENSSIDLYLDWRVATADRCGNYSGSGYSDRLRLDAEALRRFGFDVSGDLGSEEVRRRLDNQPSRMAWFVLEQDGPAYQKALEHAIQWRDQTQAEATADAKEHSVLESARTCLEEEQRSASRLFVVDLAPDKEGLRARYPDRRMYAIVRGSLNVHVVDWPGPRYVAARIHKIDVDAIRVPHTYRKIVEPLVEPRTHSRNPGPRYVTTVSFGQRLEPWIVELALLE
jgi:hypothetical protein